MYLQAVPNIPNTDDENPDDSNGDKLLSGSTDATIKVWGS